MMDYLGDLDLPAMTAAVQQFASGTPCAEGRCDDLGDSNAMDLTI
jgi:hypothetical protein